MFWFIAIFVATIVLGYSAKPKNQSNAKVQTVTAPTAEEGRVIPVLFGTKDIEQQNVVWYGDIKTVAVKQKGGKKG